MNEALYKDGSLVITFQSGVDADNKPILYKRTFKNLNKNATVENLVLTANAIASLLGHPISKVERQVTEEL